MDEYEALIRSLVTERFTQWRPRSSNRNLEYAGSTPGDTPLRPNSGVIAQVHHDKNSPDRRNVK
jgi:hypothetical protein